MADGKRPGRRRSRLAEILIPKGFGIAEYRIDRKNQQVLLTRIVLF